MATKRLARFNLITVFPDLDSAERALEVLWDADLSAGEVSLLAREVEMKPGTGEPTETMGTATSGVGRLAGAGLGGGGVAGGALGALIGAGVTAIPGVGLALGPAILYSSIAGAATGATAAGLLGAEAAGRKTMMWEQTLDPLLPLVEEGKVLLGVHSEEEDRVVAAADALEDASIEPLELHRFDAAESFHPPGDLAAVADRTIPTGHPERAGGAVGMDRVEEDDAPAVGMVERGETPTRGDRPAAVGGQDEVNEAPEDPDEDERRPR